MENKRINNFALVDDLTCMHMYNGSIGKAMGEFQKFVDIIHKAIGHLLLDINVIKTG